MRAANSNSDWLRVQQTADLLSISPSTVRRWADTGRLACRRDPSGQRRFLRDDLERNVAAAGPILAGSTSGNGAERRYQLLFETSLELASSLDLHEILQSAAQRLGDALEIPDADIYRIEGEGRMVCMASAVNRVYDGSWVGHEVSLDDWPCGRLAIESRRAVTVRSLDDPRLSDIERHEMRRFGQHSSISLPLIARDKVIGLIDLLDHGEREFTDEEVAIAEAGAHLVALALERAQLYEEVKSLHLANLRALSSALSAKDYYTLGHAGRVAAYTVMLARELGWPDDRLDELQNVAFCHDIGKIGVSDRVLLKAGPLTSEEWELVRQHPGISAEIVRPLFDEELVAGVRHHHERFDGGGYPDGLGGVEIPLVARAMCVVDCYDAMSCERPYRRALSYRQCLAELRRCAGTQFDPEIVAAFLRALQRLQKRRALVTRLAGQAARLIDPAAHTLLRTRGDEAGEQYREMVAALRRFRDTQPPVRFITSFAMVGDQCITVLDTGEVESEISHCGDPWLPEDDLARVLAGENLLANVLTADDFGVWVSSAAPVHDADGAIVAAVTVDAPALETVGRSVRADRSHTLAAMLQAAAIRFSRAEVEAITDGLTGLYNHRYLHERLEEELERARRSGSRVSLLFFDCDEFKRYNDAYGLKAGDAALGRIARITEACSR
ncbi:MAG: HD domain-containing phosphohydrolase, partial [Thermoleophilia bacterium]